MIQALEEVLQRLAYRNNSMLEKATNGNFISYNVKDEQNELINLQQEILEILWNKQHPKENSKNNEIEQDR